MPLNEARTVRLVQEHIDTGDWSPEQPDWHSWVQLGEFVKANVNGIPNPRMYEANWLKVVCNNPECPAWALVDVLYVVAGDFPAKVT